MNYYICADGSTSNSVILRKIILTVKYFLKK